MPLRVALLGCGRVTRLSHLRVLLTTPDTRVVAVADPDPAARAWAAGMAPDAKPYADFRELLSGVSADAIVVAMPTPLHRDAAVQAFDRGMHVYLEKPIAATLDHAREIIGAWRRASVVAAIGFNCRSNALYRELKAAIDRADVGPPVAVRTAYTAGWPGDATWRLRPEAGGGALLELASHHVDLLRFMFGADITSVAATTWSNRGDDQAAMLQVRLDSGLMAQTIVSYGTVEEDRVEVYGTNGKLVVDRYDSLVVERRPARAAGGIPSALRRVMQEVTGIGYGFEKRRAPGEEPSYRVSLSTFLDAVRRGQPASPDLIDGYRSLEVVDAARRSAAESRVVRLSPGEDGVR
jgi:predicted dehydrogenase